MTRNRNTQACAQKYTSSIEEKKSQVKFQNLSRMIFFYLVKFNNNKIKKIY